MSPEVERFVEVAREFCALLETATEREPAELRSRLLELLPALYLAGGRLPLPDVDADVPSGSLQLDVLVPLTEHLGGNDRFWEVFDPTQEEGPLEGSLALELSEIWFDLQEGLIALEQGVALDAVVWEFRWGLEHHWGNHLVNALRVIHWQRAW